jgi:predicted RNase H-like nuclease
VVGIDGCRRGWVLAARNTDGDAQVRVVERLDDATTGFDIIGIDMPIGLPDAWSRAADVEARRFVSPRGSTVFPAPPRALLSCASYAEANEFAKRAYGRGVSRQAWNLVPKIVEVDGLASALGDRIVEIHPECAFRALTGQVLPSKHTPAGVRSRQEALRPLFGDGVDARPAGAAADDVLDALVVLWSAGRYAAGAHVELGDGARDRLGRRMRIVY